MKHNESKDLGSGVLLACENLEVRYGSHLAVQGVSFALNKGDYLCVGGRMARAKVR